MSDSLLIASAAKNSVCINGWSSLCLEAIDNNWWGKVIEVILYLYSIICLQILGRDFLVPSLEVLCIKLKMKEDAAGATFIAFGSSAAALLITFITVLHGSDYIDLGVGSIIGSSMFGSLLIPGICALVSKKPIALPKSVVLRDVIIYAIALGLLVVFLSDKVFYPLECIFLLILFVAYLVLVFLSPLVKKNFLTSKDITNPNITTTFITSETIDSDEDMSYAPIDQLQEAADAEMAVEETFNPVDSSNAANRTGLKSSLSNGWRTFCGWCDSILKNPCRWLFHHSIPQCTSGTQFEYLFPITLLESLLFIFVITFITSAVCQRWVVFAERSGFISIFPFTKKSFIHTLLELEH